MVSMKDNIAFDIETEGFAGADGDEVTVAGFFTPDEEAIIFINTQGDTLGDSVEEKVAEKSSEDVTVIGCLEEDNLLNGVKEFTEDLDMDDERVVAYNGETWKGGFDLPFLRTRCLLNDYDWVFQGVAYMDLSKVIERRFNTKKISMSLSTLNKSPLKEFSKETGAYEFIKSGDTKAEIVEAIEETGYTDEQLEEWVRDHSRLDFEDEFMVSENGLDESYGLLGNMEDYDYDPFEDSGEAVDAYRNNDWVDLILHNLADIRRTHELTEIAMKYALNDSENRYKNTVEEKVL